MILEAGFTTLSGFGRLDGDLGIEAWTPDPF